MDIDFPLILVLLVFGSGLVWLIDALFLASGRKLALVQLQRDYPRWQEEDSPHSGEYLSRSEEVNREPLLVEYSKSFFAS